MYNVKPFDNELSQPSRQVGLSGSRRATEYNATMFQQ